MDILWPDKNDPFSTGLLAITGCTQKIIVEKDEETQIIENEKEEPLMREIQNFLDAIRDKTKQVVKSQEAVNVTKIAEAALLSSQKGTPIYLDLK